MKPKLLVLVYLSEEHRALVTQSFDMVYAPIEKPRVDRSEAAALIAAQGSDFRVVLTNGATGLTADEFAGLSALEIVCSLGVGYEHIPVEVATARGIRVCNAAGTNDAAVADHAMAILLAAIRRIPFLHNGVRKGLWRDDIPRPPHVSGRKLGIFGLGAIGRQMARRAAGFDMEIGYCSRTRRDDSGFRWFDDLHALATWCDYLLISAPAGPDTHHIVNAQVLDALGPSGVLVNVARGSLVDTAALADALRDQRIFAAALDVYEGEPLPPAALLEFDNAILTPHIAGISPQAIHASVVRFIDNATRHFAGEPLLTPVN
ncbi:2-hydroxyacid dehydrogenase [Hydrogenophaga sp. BPS33]|uniref:2-hydroxyacid dehydrogenase n=1 Tax=Hydrogenophaga sp. BPS33 TaxID=2651974 RepID=UPI00131FCA2B|nr:2-hydroxyacid dehydrogenase [Hydrogenophaga sp. BPS33]QHE86886.1 2-hydroxyacid dehydrogenase [Hydrogenophaga sp. BPS33]